ncbi:MAG: phosphoadenosine phosphosulfate reductase family protein [Cyanobacteria bacterium P01_C01_bin.120]
MKTANNSIITSLNPLESSKEIWKSALSQYTPYAVVLALSGGDDSRATYYAAKALDIPVTHVVHIHTGTGIQQTTDWVRWFANEYAQLPYLEGSAGDRFEKRVLKHGFIGRGRSAHAIAFHLLKRDVLTSVLSKIRQRKRGRKILILNGARLAESDNRAKNFANTPIRPDKKGSSNIWVNLLQHWTKADCQNICSDNKAPQNPVARELCRSGECMCGTMQSLQAREEAAALYPEWGDWLTDLERRVIKAGFPWRWADPVPKCWAAEKAGQMRLFDSETFQPMCTSCNAKN